MESSKHTRTQCIRFPNTHHQASVATNVLSHLCSQYPPLFFLNLMGNVLISKTQFSKVGKKMYTPVQPIFLLPLKVHCASFQSDLLREETTTGVSLFLDAPLPALPRLCTCFEEQNFCESQPTPDDFSPSDMSLHFFHSFIRKLILVQPFFALADSMGMKVLTSFYILTTRETP